MLKSAFLLAADAGLMAMSTAAQQERAPAPDGAGVHFVSPENGATVSLPLIVNFGLRRMGVAPAGTEREATGHHHILVYRPAFGEADMDDEAMAKGLTADDTTCISAAVRRSSQCRWNRERTRCNRSLTTRSTSRTICPWCQSASR